MRAQSAEEAALAPADRASSRSQLGFDLTIARGCFEAASRRQYSTALSSAEAEIFAASTAASRLLSVTPAVTGILVYDRVSSHVTLLSCGGGDAPA